MISFQLILDAYDRTTLSPPLRSGTSPDQGRLARRSRCCGCTTGTRQYVG